MIISGPAHVIDGDTLVIAGEHIRLKGVDAAELKTPLGEAAKLAMIGLAEGKMVTCILTGERSYDRLVGYCFLTDLGQAIIEQGKALACPRFEPFYSQFERPSQQARAKYCERKP